MHYCVWPCLQGCLLYAVMMQLRSRRRRLHDFFGGPRYSITLLMQAFCHPAAPAMSACSKIWQGRSLPGWASTPAMWCCAASTLPGLPLAACVLWALRYACPCINWRTYAADIAQEFAIMGSLHMCVSFLSQ